MLKDVSNNEHIIATAEEIDSLFDMLIIGDKDDIEMAHDILMICPVAFNQQTIIALNNRMRDFYTHTIRKRIEKAIGNIIWKSQEKVLTTKYNTLYQKMELIRSGSMAF